MRIGWDLDGVDYAFSDSVVRYFESINLETKAEHGDPDSWHFYEKWGLTEEQFRKYVDDGVDAGVIFCGPARKHAAYAHWVVRNAGNTIHIVTHRYQGSPGNAERNTLKWLDDNYLSYDTIDFVEDKTSVPTDMFIEDKVSNYDALIEAGVDAYLVNRPWNTPHDDGRKRVDNVVEFADIVRAKSKELTNAS